MLGGSPASTWLLMSAEYFDHPTFQQPNSILEGSESSITSTKCRWTSCLWIYKRPSSNCLQTREVAKRKLSLKCCKLASVASVSAAKEFCKLRWVLIG